MLRHRAVAILSLVAMTAFPSKRSSNRTAEPKETPVAAASRTRTTPAQSKSAPKVSAERQAVQKWLRGMSLRDQIAQLVVITSYGESPSSRSKAYRDYLHAVRNLKVGGIIVVNRVVQGSVRNAEPHAMATFLNRMQKAAKVPLLVAADFERGASMRVSGTTKFPHQMTYGAANDLELTGLLGRATAREARALGVHWVFAPVADVNNNPDNPIINIRSFGEDPKQVGNHVRAFISGAHSDPQNRVLVTVKHFPGHGDTNVDSHMGLATLAADRDRIEKVELEPFRAAISGGVDAVMTAHMAVPAYEPREIPATVSVPVLTGLLRKELNFGGLIVTDAMDMQGLTKQFPGGEAAVRALEAGADVLLMPPNPEGVIKAVMDAVAEGRLSRKRIADSVVKVLSAKARVGLHRSKLVDVEKISDAIESDEAADLAQRAADRGVTLLRNGDGLVPLRQPKEACVFVLTESRGGQQGRKFVEEYQRRVPGGRFAVLDPQARESEVEEVHSRLSDCRVNVVAAFVSVSAYRGNVALAGMFPMLVERLTAEETPVLLIALGSPYLIRSFPEVSGYMITYTPGPAGESAAVRALLGEMRVTGKLPVTIPDIAKIGDGIRIDLQTSGGSQQ